MIILLNDKKEIPNLIPFLSSNSRLREQLVQECRENVKNVKMSAIDKMRVVRRQTINGTEDRLADYASHAKSLGDLEVLTPTMIATTVSL